MPIPSRIINNAPISARKMKFALITNALQPPYDEGIRKFASITSEIFVRNGYPVYSILSQSHFMNKKLFISRTLINHVINNHPEILIYIPTQSASLASFIRASFLKLFSRARIVLIALQPTNYKIFQVPFIRLFHLDLVLTPSMEVYNRLTNLNKLCDLIPMGIDLGRFQPITIERKNQLREKYSLPADKFVLLHVGHIQPRRNLRWIVRASEQYDSCVIVVGSESMGVAADIHEKLKKSDIHIINKYLDNIEEIYQLADCYLFPVLDDQAAIGTPLSVLEAMACNLPVVTTPFGLLPKLFTPGNGLFYADKEEDFLKKISDARNLNVSEIKNREKVSPFDWDSVVNEILIKAQTLCNRV